MGQCITCGGKTRMATTAATREERKKTGDICTSCREVCKCGNKKEWASKRCMECCSIKRPSREELMWAISLSKTGADCLKFLNLDSAGHIYTLLRRWCEYYDIPFPFRRKYSEMSNEEIFIENATFNHNDNYILRRRIHKDDLLNYQCTICKLGPEWNGKSLTLQLDHINGISNDHRLENLRFLCPNCHTQTPTYYKGAHADTKVSS